jgi:cell division protein DivIC
MRSKTKKSTKVIDLAEAREQRRLKREAEAQKKQQKINSASSKKSKKSDRKNHQSDRKRLLVAGVFLIIFLILGISSYNIVSLKIQEAEAIALKQQLLEEKEHLKQELSLVYSPAYIEQQARTQLRMIKPGELIYIFPKTADPTTEGDNGQ